jgi:hypothetical protein
VAEAFEAVPWASLRHVFGPASDLPDYFRNLLSPIREARDWALDELGGKLFHQGTVSEATLRAVPILFGLVERPGVRVRTDIAVLLAEIAQAESGVAAADCRQAVGERLDLLLPYLRHRDPVVREIIAGALGRYPERASGLVPLLRARLARESSPDVRPSLEDAIGRLERS